MKRLFRRGTAALLAMSFAHSAQAEDAANSPADTETATAGEATDEIVVTPVSLHPAAGLMNEHTHDGGELMLGLRYLRSRYSGANRSGTDRIADADILAAGYSVRAQEMTMDMVMLDIMYAPNDKLTLMVMPHWMRHEMTMVGIDPANTGMAMPPMDGAMDQGHNHTGLPFGDTMTHGTEGFGDTLVSASYRLMNARDFKAHATLGVWLPTGKIDRMNADGTFVHYGMQSGSGTWDIEPSVTVSGTADSLGWGAQASYRWRTESENSSGFAFGDKAVLTGWLSYLLSSSTSVTSRLSWEHEGQILGHYNGPHRHSSPADRQENYGGDTVRAAIGANVALPFGGRDRPQLGVEFGVPIYQNLNGIQVPEKWRLALSLGKAF